MGKLRTAVLAAVITLGVVPVIAALSTATAAAATPPVNAITVGGLNLDQYCRARGQMVLLKGNIVAPGAAFQWYCVSSNGKAIPINMTSACQFQYPGQNTSAFAGDSNNAYSWVCISPNHGHVVYGPGYIAYTSKAGTITIVYGGTVQISYASPSGGGAVLVINSDGSGYLAFDGAGSGNAGVITFDGAGGVTTG